MWQLQWGTDSTRLLQLWWSRLIKLPNESSAWVGFVFQDQVQVNLQLHRFEVVLNFILIKKRNERMLKLKLQHSLYRLNGQENRSNKRRNVLHLNANFINWPTDTHTRPSSQFPTPAQVLNIISTLSPRGLEMELESDSNSKSNSKSKLLKRARKTNKMLLLLLHFVSTF